MLATEESLGDCSIGEMPDAATVALASILDADQQGASAASGQQASFHVTSDDVGYSQEEWQVVHVGCACTCSLCGSTCECSQNAVSVVSTYGGAWELVCNSLERDQRVLVGSAAVDAKYLKLIDSADKC